VISRKTRMRYKQSVKIGDRELAQAFDEWLGKQPQEVSVTAVCHVTSILHSVPGIGEFGAKALIFRLYGEILTIRDVSAS